jgi:hypothetical protein
MQGSSIQTFIVCQNEKNILLPMRKIGEAGAFPMAGGETDMPKMHRLGGKGG